MCRLVSAPIDLNPKLREVEKDVVINREMYQCLIERLIYLSQTRPNIAYAISVISQFMHNPKEVNLQVAN